MDCTGIVPSGSVASRCANAGDANCDVELLVSKTMSVAPEAVTVIDGINAAPAPLTVPVCRTVLLDVTTSYQRTTGSVPVESATCCAIHSEPLRQTGGLVR